MVDIWADRLWLPDNTTWDDFKPRNGLHFPQREEFLYSIAIGVAMLAIRIVMESTVFLPIGWLGGWVKGPLTPAVIRHMTGGFAGMIGWTLGYLDLSGRSKFKRVAECAWRFTYYLFAWTAGYLVLRNEPQFSDLVECWRNWPAHPISTPVWWYYLGSAGFYWGLLFSQLFFDVRRADFLQMTLHHSITILLLWISWSLNTVRVGTLVLFSHDVGDILLELGKLFRYAGWQNALTVDFIIFSVVWVASRLVFYPFWLVHSVILEAPKHMQDSYEWLDLLQRPILPRVLLFMLSTLVILHILWTAVIAYIAYTAFMKGGEVGDVREEGDESDEEEEEEKKKRE